MIYIVTVDECQVGSGGCRQVCKITVEGFECGCLNGYALASDQRTCNGE